jgi:hypothetical protein
VIAQGSDRDADPHTTGSDDRNVDFAAGGHAVADPWGHGWPVSGSPPPPADPDLATWIRPERVAPKL